MSYDVPSNRLLRVRIEHRTGSTIDLGNNLVCDNDCNAEFIGEPLQGAHEFGQMHLSVGELATAVEISAIERGCAVDDEEGEAGLGHHLGGLVQ